MYALMVAGKRIALSRKYARVPSPPLATTRSQFAKYVETMRESLGKRRRANVIHYFYIVCYAKRAN